MKTTQPLIMISDYFTHILRHHYGIEGAYIRELNHGDYHGLVFINLNEDNFDDSARMELFAKDMTEITSALQHDTDSSDPQMEFDSGQNTLFVEDLKTCLDILTALSDRYNWGLDKKLDELASPKENFKLTRQFSAMAEKALETPQILAALDSTEGYIGREGLYIAVLKAKALQSCYPLRPVYSLEDIRNAFHADDLIQQENPAAKTPQPCFWIH